MERIVADLSAGGLSPEVLLTRSAADPPAFARQLTAAGGRPLIIAAGGDGTINGIVNGIAPGAATIALLPLGTANVLARELGIASVADAVQRIVRGVSRPLAVGLLEWAAGKRYFCLMAGIGFDGAVVAGVRGREKRLLSQGAYLLSAIRCLRGWDRTELAVSVDGRTECCHSVVVCKAKHYGGPFRLAPEADLFRPDLQVVCVKSGKRTAYLRLVCRVMAGRSVVGADVVVFTGTEVAIAGSKAVQLDGDYICDAPVAVRAMGDFAQLIV